jgi:elongation factor P hydroxylase
VEELEERLENKWGNGPCYERHTTTNLETGTDETVYLPTGNCN